MRFIFTTALFFLVSLLQRESLLVAERHRVDRHLYVVVANMTVAAPLPPHAGMGFLRRLELSSFWNRMCFSACRGALIPVSSHSYSHTVGLLTEMTRRSGVLSGSLGTRLSPRLILRPSSPPPPYPESNWRLRLPPLLPSSEEVHTITFYAGQSLSDHSFILVFAFIACYSSFRRLFATFFVSPARCGGCSSRLLYSLSSLPHSGEIYPTPSFVSQYRQTITEFSLLRSFLLRPILLQPSTS